MKEVFAQTLSQGDQHKCVHATVFMYNPQELRCNFLQVRHNLLFYLLRICSLWPYVLTSTERTKQYASISVAIYNLAIKVFWVKKLPIICCLIKSNLSLRCTQNIAIFQHFKWKKSWLTGHFTMQIGGPGIPRWSKDKIQYLYYDQL